MSKYTVTNKTYKEIAAEFAAGFKNVTPPVTPKPVSQADWLEPYRAHVMKQRRRGLTWKQIAEVMTLPPIGVPVTDRILMRIFGDERKTPTPLSSAKEKAGTQRANSTCTPDAAHPNSTASATPSLPDV